MTEQIELQRIEDENKPEEKQEDVNAKLAELVQKYDDLTKQHNELQAKYHEALVENNKIYKKLTNQNKPEDTETEFDMLRKHYNI